MLQAHSWLWHYLWVAPNALLVALAAILWTRGLQKTYPALIAFFTVASIEQLVVYACDVLPFVAAETFWRALAVGAVLDAIFKFILIGELFSRIFGSYPSIAGLGAILIRCVGVLLILVAALAAAFSRTANAHLIVAGPHLLEQAVYVVESGLLVFIFLFIGYFNLRPDRTTMGICIGLALSSCVQLATWALATGNSSQQMSVRLDFVRMATYHLCVLIWCYYLLVPQKVRAIESAVSLPENNLAVWNRELERLLQQ